MDLEVFKENATTNETLNGDEKKANKKETNRFEFALYVNDFLICRRSFQINGYVEGSMQTLEFKDAVDNIVEILDEDLKSKSRVWSWYHLWPEKPELEPEMVEPLCDEWATVFKFVIYENGNEVISRIWDGRYYPSYVRKNVDLTNRQIKIIKDERTITYDKDVFFEANGNQISGELYVLKAMISDKDNLIPKIQKCIFEVCSSYDGYYENFSDYHTTLYYGNTVTKINKDDNSVSHEKVKNKGKKYNLNIEQENKKLASSWGSSVSEKTKKYMKELYVSPKEKYYKRASDAE